MAEIQKERLTDELEELKNENLELKLSAVRKDVASLKTDLHQHLDRILEQTSKTNGSVAKSLERIHIIEKQDNKTKIDKLLLEFKEYKEKTKFWTVLSENRWILFIIFFLTYTLSIYEVRESLFLLLKLR